MQKCLVDYAVISNSNIVKSKLLAQSVFKVSAFRFNTRMKTPVPLPDCRINIVLIQ